MKFIYSFGFICLSVFFIACKANKVIDHKAKLRTINASYQAGDINLFIDYEKVYASNIQYLNFSLFREFIEGKHNVQIKDANNNILVDTALLMTENKHYSLFLYDSMNINRYKVIDENFVTANGSACKVRFLQLSNNAPSVDLLRDNDTLAFCKQFSNGINSEYLTMNDGKHQFKAYTSTGANLLTTQNEYDYKAGAFYTLYLRGNVGSMGTDSLSFFVIESTLDYL